MDRVMKKTPEWYCPHCLIPHGSRGIWVECEGCQLWYHARCAGYEGWSEEDLTSETFVCGICVSELNMLAVD